MKRVDTMIIEKVLQNSLFGTNPKLAKEYGTAEVTLSQLGITNGKEIVDFMSYDTNKDTFRCYEIKVTMTDFHSKAKKSWYGNYNYLVLSEDLYSEKPLSWWITQIEEGIGIIVINTSTTEKQTVVKSKKKDITDDTKILLRNSLIRTLFYQNQNKNWYLRKDN